MAETSGSARRPRRVLLVSPQFPPSSLVGAHRVRHLAAHLPTHGWQPTVVTVRPQDHAETLDHRLSALVPGDVPILRVPAVPVGLARRFGIGDLGLRAYFPLRAAVLSALARERPDLVLVTGFPFYPMLMAGAVRRRGVPVVLDFQDPWISDWGAGRPRLSKAGLSHRLATVLEPRAVAAASGLVTVSDAQGRAMRARYPSIPAERCLALPIGGDWADYEAVRPTDTDIDTGGRVVLYAGTYWPRARPAFTAFFRALAGLRATAPERLAGVRFRFVGTAAVPDRRAAAAVTPLAAEHGVADLVDETPWRLPYLDALGLMRGAHANLLLGSDEPHYTASKIYPALMSGRPFLSVFHQESSAHAVLARSGGGVALSFGDGAPPAAIEAEIASGLVRVLEEGDGLGRADPAVIAPFTAPEIARTCARFLDRIVALEAGIGP